MKEKRQLADKLSTIRILGDGDEENDLVAWIEKNRKVEQKRSRKENQRTCDIFETHKREKMKEKYA